MIENILTALSTDDNMLFFDEYSGDATFCCSQMGILSIDLSNINFYDTNYYEDDPKTIIHIRHIKFKKRKALKKR